MSVCLTMTLVTWTPDPDTDYCEQAQQAQPVVTRPSCDDQAMGLLSSDDDEEVWSVLNLGPERHHGPRKRLIS